MILLPIINLFFDYVFVCIFVLNSKFIIILGTLLYKIIHLFYLFIYFLKFFNLWYNVFSGFEPFYFFGNISYSLIIHLLQYDYPVDAEYKSYYFNRKQNFKFLF